MRGVPAADSAQFWQLRQWPGIELMSANWVRHSFPKHMHQCYTIGINVHGRGTFDCRGQRQDAWPGRINLIEPGETHTGRAVEGLGWAYFDFYIDEQAMRTLAEQAGSEVLPGFRSAAVEDIQLAQMFQRTFDATVVPTSQLEQDYLLLAAVRSLCARHSDLRKITQVRSGWECGAVEQIRDYLHANYAAEIPIARLAEIARWSPYRLIRTFHRYLGLTPHAYQNVLRICESQKRLRRGEPIASVAAACGFYDQSHMNRYFRRLIGTTPAQYVRAAAISSKTPRL